MMNKYAGFIVRAILVLVFVIYGYFVATTAKIAQSDYTRSEVYQEAVEAGAGEYYLDNEHNRQFRWVSSE